MFNFYKKKQSETDNLNNQLSDIRRIEEDRQKKQFIEKWKEREIYNQSDPSVRSRIDAKRDNQQSYDDYLTKRRTKLRGIVTKSLPDDAVKLLAAAKDCSEELVRVEATEGILESLSSTPYAFDLIADYRNLLAIPTLIRELWSYKPTTIRTIQMLDFIRWICRVIYEECPTTYAVVQGKVNFIFGGKGISFKVNSKLDGENDELVERCEEIINEFVERNEYHDVEKEVYRRKLIDGEAFLRFVERKDGCEVCCIEPDYIRPSQKKATNQEDPHISGIGGEDWSFGVLTPKHNYQKPLAYQVVWNDNEEEVVKVDDMFHVAVKERKNIKRCVPPIFKLVDDYIRMTLLRQALAESSKFRASIAGVIQYAHADLQSVKSWEETVKSSWQPAIPMSDYVKPIEYKEPVSNLIDLPSGREFADGPQFPDSGSLETIYNWHIWAIAAAESCPEWLVKGASSGSSFADSFTAESPSVKAFETAQQDACGFSKKVYKRLLRSYINRGELPEDLFDLIDIELTPDSIITRDSKSEVEENVMKLDKRIQSLATTRAILGLDNDQENRTIQEEEAAGLLPPIELGLGKNPDSTSTQKQPETTDGYRQKLET